MTTEPLFHCAQYLNLGTFRRDGRRVDTPVWFAEANGAFYAFSTRDAGKIKRLNNGSRCAIAPCTFSGTPTGPWRETEARVLNEQKDIDAAYRALKAKYGWQMTLLNTGARLGGRVDKRAFIRITPPSKTL